jgi:hypothetical protein
VVGSHDVSLPRHVAALHGTPQRETFNHHTKIGEIAQGLFAQGHNLETLVGLALNESLLSKARKGLPYNA